MRNRGKAKMGSILPVIFLFAFGKPILQKMSKVKSVFFYFAES